MAITEKTDKEILEIAQPMIDEVVNASNSKDWATFSKYQTQEEAQDPENRKHVEKQWNNNPLFNSLILDREILGILRREDVAQIIWKQNGSSVTEDYLASYFVKEINQEVKEVGFIIQ